MLSTNVPFVYMSTFERVWWFDIFSLVIFFVYCTKVGTYTIQDEQKTSDILDWALSAGYRLIDTAAVYGNEQVIGSALKNLLPKHNLKREDIFITSKLSPTEQGGGARDAAARSLQNLQCGYLDLYLIHWPGRPGIPKDSPENAKLRAASWGALVKAKEEGLVRDIGVSNYMAGHLSELLDDCHGVKPVVNQVEWHPSCHPEDLQKLCESQGILLQGYGAFGGNGNTILLADPLVVAIAQKLDRSPAQVLLRWAIQQNVAIIPKAQSREHLYANMDLNFDIPAEDMFRLSSRKHERFAYWNPTLVK